MNPHGNLCISMQNGKVNGTVVNPRDRNGKVKTICKKPMQQENQGV